jgi:lysophospholipid acyltransferase (LPLAT)-like uncharacterized protein
MSFSRRDHLLFVLVETLGPLVVRAVCSAGPWRSVTAPDAASRLSRREPVIFAFWHGGLLPLVYTHRNRRIQVLVSQNKDGEIITRIIERMGYGTVRGSSSRGGSEALRELLGHAKLKLSLGITPDGPRGPRREVQDGLIALAALSGVPIAPLAASATRAWQLDSWDRFEIPKPFARRFLVSGPLVWVPREAREDLSRWRGIVQQALDETTFHAEILARGEGPPAKAGARA